MCGLGGGRRDGAGRRKRMGCVAHRSRDKVTRHDPRLVTMKCAKELPSLRSPRGEQVIAGAIRSAQRDAFRIVEYSIQSNHLHFVLEADDARALANGMRSLTCRVARGLNRLWSRRGAVFPRRFHDRVLRSLRQVRNALRYVLNNYLKHEHVPTTVRGAAVVDPYSSARWFDGWREGARAWGGGDGRRPAVVRGGWKLGVGWRRYALISVREVPGAIAGRR